MDLTQGNIKKQLISMAVPAGIGMLFYTLYNVVDTLMYQQHYIMYKKASQYQQAQPC